MNIKEVAKRAGVSISTVSRVINNTAKVNEETRRKVEVVIEETGYRPNVLARELQQNKTNTIGVIISVDKLNVSSIGETIDAITDVARDAGYSLMLANTRFHIDEELEYFKVFQEKRVDGILYFASYFTEKHYALLNNYPIPIVMIGQSNDKIQCPAVVHDDYYGAKAAVSYLIQKGHKDIAFIGGPSKDKAVGEMRFMGFKDALEESQLHCKESYCAQGDFSLNSGYEAMRQILRISHELLPTAVFAATDYMALGAMKAIREVGLKVPHDLSVVGFDNIDVASFAVPPLTTIHSDKNGVGRKAGQLLLDMIDKKSVKLEKYIAEFSLIERESVISRG